MVKKELTIITAINEQRPLSLAELAQLCHLPVHIINQLVEYEVIHPAGEHPQTWRFTAEELRRVQIAQRLQHDLEINLAGVAMVLDLLDELHELRAQMQVFKKHYENK